ncbi:hypothetical protein R1flu_003836 [Riccia fluitans]|uniref:Uncharacterized protein n=1 Tax=Riccia fluitans TaxID=41844 RepID=A0ABD1YA34_9MARC
MGDLAGRTMVGHGDRARRPPSHCPTGEAGGRSGWAGVLRLAAIALQAGVALKCPVGHSRVGEVRGGKSL